MKKGKPGKDTAQEELRKNYRDLVDNLNSIILRWKPTGEITFFNKYAQSFFGYSEEEILGKNVMILAPQRDSLGKDLTHLAEDILKFPEKYVTNENENVRKNGERVWIQWTNKASVDEAGNIREILVVGTDVTKKKQTEIALQKSAERHRLLAETMLQGVVYQDAAGKIITMNPAAERILGKTPGEFLGRTSVDEECHALREDGTPFPGLDHPAMVALRTGQTVADVVMGVFNPREKAYRWIDISAVPLFEPGDTEAREVYTVFEDITERKQRERMVKLQAAVAETVAEGIFLIGVDDNIIKWTNTKFEKMFGYGPGEMIGMHVDKVNAPTDKTPTETRASIVDLLLETGEWHGEIKNIKKDGTVFWCFIHVSLFDHPEFGRVMVSAHTDITERKQIEEALRESEALYRAIGESINYGVWVCAPDGRNTYASESFLKMVGLTQEECSNFGWGKVLHPDDAERTIAAWQECARTGGVWDIEHRFKGVDGKWHHVLARGIPVRDENGRITLWAGINLDIDAFKEMEEELRRSRDELELRVQERTAELSQAYERLVEETKERSKLEDQLRQSQKMEAIGTLAGGIAHDFNNMLAGIIGFTEMAAEDAQDRPDVQKSLQNVLKAAIRARDLVKQILTFSRQIGQQRSAFSLSPIIKETVQLLRASIPTMIEIRFSATATSDMVIASPTEVQQIIMNLATNASLAMQKEGGIMEVALSDIDLALEPSVSSLHVMPGEYVQLMVRDTGMGMSPDVMKRAFDPFFTTKEVGKGTGMGLAVVYGIVKDLHGTITVESELGVGSTFRVFLPKAKTDKQAEEARIAEIPGGNERVLFVDDEEMLAEWGRAILERLGYTVTTMTSGQEALDIFSADPTLFDLVIADYAMPQITGAQLATGILTIRKNIPIILCTGHSDSISPESARELGISEFLMKPLGKQELAVVIRRLLDAQVEQ